MGVFEPPGGYWDSNLSPLQEEQVLLTLSHLSSPNLPPSFWMGFQCSSDCPGTYSAEHAGLNSEIYLPLLPKYLE